MCTSFSGYSQSDESGDGPEDEPAACEQAEHAERGSADEQAQPSEHTQVSRIYVRSTFVPVKLTCPRASSGSRIRVECFPSILEKSRSLGSVNE